MTDYRILALIAHATNERERANEEWRRLIRDAVKSGERAADVAEAARISTARVYQIRDGRR